MISGNCNCMLGWNSLKLRPPYRANGLYQSIEPLSGVSCGARQKIWATSMFKTAMIISEDHRISISLMLQWRHFRFEAFKPEQDRLTNEQLSTTLGRLTSRLQIIFFVSMMSLPVLRLLYKSYIFGFQSLPYPLWNFGDIISGLKHCNMCANERLSYEHLSTTLRRRVSVTITQSCHFRSKTIIQIIYFGFRVSSHFSLFLCSLIDFDQILWQTILNEMSINIANVLLNGEARSSWPVSWSSRPFWVCSPVLLSISNNTDVERWKIKNPLKFNSFLSPSYVMNLAGVLRKVKWLGIGNCVIYTGRPGNINISRQQGYFQRWIEFFIGYSA